MFGTTDSVSIGRWGSEYNCVSLEEIVSHENCLATSWRASLTIEFRSRSFVNGSITAVLLREWSACQNQACTTRKVMLGIACCSKASTTAPLLPGRPHPHSSAPPQPTDQVRAANFSQERFRSLHRCNWEVSTTHGARWSGKSLPAATQRNPPDCLLSIHNWSVIPG